MLRSEISHDECRSSPNIAKLKILADRTQKQAAGVNNRIHTLAGSLQAVGFENVSLLDVPIEPDSSPIQHKRPNSMIEDVDELKQNPKSQEADGQCLVCGETVDTEDIIGAIAPRISAVIQAYYMCCSCQTNQK